VGFEFCDPRFVAQSQADVVEAFQQSPSSVFVDLE
jgi:hypothetical protein